MFCLSDAWVWFLAVAGPKSGAWDVADLTFRFPRGHQSEQAGAQNGRKSECAVCKTIGVGSGVVGWFLGGVCKTCAKLRACVQNSRKSFANMPFSTSLKTLGFIPQHPPCVQNFFVCAKLLQRGLLGRATSFTSITRFCTNVNV